MNTLRTRLSVLDLEARANPSGPEAIAPYTPPGDTTVVDTTTDTTTTTGIGGLITTVTTTTATTTTTGLFSGIAVP